MFFFFFLIFIGVELIYNVVLVSGEGLRLLFPVVATIPSMLLGTQ